MNQVAIKALKHLKLLLHSVTFDNGKEFAKQSGIGDEIENEHLLRKALQILR